MKAHGCMCLSSGIGLPMESASSASAGASLFAYRQENYVECEGVVVSEEQFRVLGITHRMLPEFGVVRE